jgi:hypothetical protein
LDVYTGDWKDDMAEGEGTFTHFNGATYVGQWFKDK